jgi:hypothetical protein
MGSLAFGMPRLRRMKRRTRMGILHLDPMRSRREESIIDFKFTGLPPLNRSVTVIILVPSF